MLWAFGDVDVEIQPLHLRHRMTEQGVDLIGDVGAVHTIAAGAQLDVRCPRFSARHHPGKKNDTDDRPTSTYATAAHGAASISRSDVGATASITRSVPVSTARC